MVHAFEEALNLLKRFAARPDNVSRVDDVAELVAASIRSGGKVLACGNGGSACDAMHFCEELTGRFRNDRRALPAIACSDPGHITCTANDYGYDEVFARWVAALGSAGDVLFVLSTSGNSRNVLRAVDVASVAGVRTVALLGRDGGQLAGRCDHEWIVADDDRGRDLTADRIQEIHMLVLHTLIEHIERALFA